MRVAWYAGVSTALAASVALSALHQRPNYYSAMVHLAQSNFCLLVLVNFALLIYGSFIYGLQRLLFGPLRPAEVEQLTEKAWFTVTESTLAMTIFRDEMGPWFFAMYTALLTGKVWGWIGDGRIEILEQQPPANPRLFHTRLFSSLLLSIIFDLALFHYSALSVIQQARPNMMVMFLFEFAVLLLCSMRTWMRYVLSLYESSIVRTQTAQRMEERRRQGREEAAILVRSSQRGGDAAQPLDLPNPDDVDEMDIEVPGWEAKGQWVLVLELLTDFLKLVLYAMFFAMLLIFYGLPIHILRDLFMTSRSFLKRLGALIRYRRALQDMNKYPDATAADLTRDATCIICRETMNPWDPANNPGAIEKSRPKKLPCNHILHLGCLKSWLERQQVCPTCRSPVVLNGGAAQRRPDGLFPRMQFNGGGPAAQGPAQGDAQAQANRGGAGAGQGDQAPARNDGLRVFNLGPIRLGFMAGAAAQDAIRAAQNGGVQAPARRSIDTQLQDIYDQMQRDLQSLQRRQQDMQSQFMEYNTLQLYNAEIRRIRQQRQQPPRDAARPQVAPGATNGPGIANSTGLTNGAGNGAASSAANGSAIGPAIGSAPNQHPATISPSVPHLQFPPAQGRHGLTSVLSRHAPSSANVIPAGSPDLPDGVVLPPGWTLLPLQRVDSVQNLQQQGLAVSPNQGGGNPPNDSERPLRPSGSDSLLGRHIQRFPTPQAWSPSATEGSRPITIGPHANETAFRSWTQQTPNVAAHAAAADSAASAPSGQSTATGHDDLARIADNNSEWDAIFGSPESRRQFAGTDSPAGANASVEQPTAGFTGIDFSRRRTMAANSSQGATIPRVPPLNQAAEDAARSGEADPRDKGKGRATTVEDAVNDSD